MNMRLLSRKVSLLVIAGAGVVLSTLLPAPAPSQSDFIVPTRPLPQGRGFHGSAVMGDHLYVFGGRVAGANPGSRDAEEDTTSTLVAPIGPGGHVGNWRPTTPLPGPRYYIANSTLVMNDVVYIVGGSDAVLGGQAQNTAIWSRPLPNGNLTAWQQSAPFGDGLNTPAAVTTPGHIHVIGGTRRVDGNPTVTREVWTNQIYADGSLGRWEMGTPLPFPLWFHQAGVVAGRVYVWGGLQTPQSTAANINPIPIIMSAPILGSGRLGEWRRESPDLRQGFYSAPSAVAGNFLMSFMPRLQGAVNDDHVHFTQVAPGGRLAQWGSHRAPVPNRVYHAVAADYRRGAIYITGGRGPTRDDNLLPATSFFTLSASARQQAEQAWVAAQTAHSNSVSAAPGTGQQTGGTLTYIADRQLQEGAVRGFRTVSDARTRATNQRIPLIMYFQIPDAAPCIEQKNLLETPEFARLAEVASFAWIDSTEYPQLVQQLAVYRVPTWVFYDPAGNERFRHIGVLDIGQIVEALTIMAQGARGS